MHVQVCYGVIRDLDQLPSGGYTYEDGDLGVTVGDVVEVPPTWVSLRDHEERLLATVCSLTDVWEGEANPIVSIVERSSAWKKARPGMRRRAREYRKAARALPADCPQAAALLAAEADRLLRCYP